MTLKIAIVDDHALFLTGVSQLLEQINGKPEVAAYGSGLDLLEDIDSGSRPDVVITDLAMKDINGLGLIRAIRARNLDVPVIVLSASEDAVTRANADVAGACCFLHKSIDEAALADAIKKAVATGAARVRSADSTQLADAVIHPTLSPQQLRILGLIATGARNAEIADQLSISENTVKSHVKAVFRELGVNTRTAAAQRGRELALL